MCVCVCVLGDILEHIVAQGYEISAAQSMIFEKAQAEEFLKVKKKNLFLFYVNIY